jgi:Mn2+/Fe2+ NRAMP family transporter
VCIAFLVEMAGRLAAVSRHTLPDAMRERFGIAFFLVPLVTVALVSFLVLASEVGGVCLALQFASGVSLRWWTIPVVLLLWLFLWKGTFGLVEKGASLLGLVTLAFVVGAVRLHPDPGKLAAGLLPSLPHQDPASYWFMAVSIVGASVSPYLFYFYSAGAIEDEWDEDYIPINRIIAGLGMTFGGGVAVAVLVCAALVLHPAGIQVDRYEQIPLLLASPLGRAGFWLFVASLGVACFGAALEIALQLAYLAAQGFGWRWGENLRPREASRFALVYTLALPLAGLLTALSLPVTVVPLLVLMNDPDYLRERTNGWISNTAVLAVSVVACIVALVAIPLELFGS